MSSGSETVEQRLTDTMTKILAALKIDSNQQDQILSEMKTYSTDLKLRIINYSKFDEHLDEMLNADRELANLMANNQELKSYYDKNLIKDEWDKSMQELAKLQGLIILRKVAQQDCDGLIKALLNAFNVKISAVNNILSSDLKDKGTSPKPPSPTNLPEITENLKNQEGGGNDDKYRAKYLKYKAKYLNLVKNNF